MVDVQRWVVPFYLGMMRCNSLDAAPDLLAALRQEVAAVPVHVVTTLLHEGGWRESVMGAWYAAGRPDLPVGDAVAAALLRSYGDLDAPPLMAALVLTCPAEAAAVVRLYTRKDERLGLGAAAFGHAAAAVLGEPTGKVDPGTARAFEGLLAVGRSLVVAAG